MHKFIDKRLVLQKCKFCFIKCLYMYKYVCVCVRIQINNKETRDLIMLFLSVVANPSNRKEHYLLST